MRIASFLSCLLLTLLFAFDAAAAPKERCSDGKDNDGDGLIDAADPDCGSTNQDLVWEWSFEALVEKQSYIRTLVEAVPVEGTGLSVDGQSYRHSIIEGDQTVKGKAFRFKQVSLSAGQNGLPYEVCNGVDGIAVSNSILWYNDDGFIQVATKPIEDSLDVTDPSANVNCFGDLVEVLMQFDVVAAGGAYRCASGGFAYVGRNPDPDPNALEVGFSRLSNYVPVENLYVSLEAAGEQYFADGRIDIPANCD